MKRTARLAGMLLASGGLLVISPVATQAATRTATTGVVTPAVTRHCASNEVELYTASTNVHTCLLGGYAHSVNFYECNFDWVNTGNNWVAFTWGVNNYSSYQPGMAPWTTWSIGQPVCIGRIDIDT
ncbi:MAG: hypothetical protein HOW97_17505 [Catenulispora sp.]|nr:hypothetical protein [Catenulispora sp.]